MNDEIDLRLAKELPFENEIVVQNCINFHSIKDVVEYAETLIKEEKFDDFCIMLGSLCHGDIFRQLLEDEAFLISYLRYQLHIQRYPEIFQILQNIESTSNPIFLEIWEEAHYQQYWSTHGKLTSVHKCRIRQRNPPPAGLCGDGVRPHRRLLPTTSAVFREWFDKHSTYPYPCKAAKRALARRAGVSINQVTAWFSNARRKEKIKLDKSRKSAFSVSNTHYDKQESKTNDLKKGTKTKALSNIAAEEPYTILEQNEMLEEEIEENMELTTIQTTENENTLSDLLPARTQNALPSWSSNLPGTVQTARQRNALTSLSPPLGEHNNIHTVLHSSVKEKADLQFKYLNILSEGFRHSNNRTVYIHDEDGIKPCTGGKREYTISRCPCLKKKVDPINMKAPGVIDNTKYKMDNMASNEKDILDYRTNFKKGKLPDCLKENSKEASIKKKLHAKTVKKSNNVTSNGAANGEMIKKMSNKENEINMRKQYLKDAYTKDTRSLFESQHQSEKDVDNYERKDRQICPKLKFDEMHCEIKIPNETSLQKLRERLREHKQVLKQRRGSSFTALDSLKSLQKLCDDIEVDVKSPKDFACSVKFESLTDSDYENFTEIGNNTLTRDNAQYNADLENVSGVEYGVEMGNMCKLVNDTSIRKDTQEKVINEISKRNHIVNIYEKEWLSAMNDVEPYPGGETRAMLNSEWRYGEIEISKSGPSHTDQLVPISPELLYSSTTPLVPSSPELPFSPVTPLVPSSPTSYPMIASFPDFHSSSVISFDQSSTELPCAQEIFRSSLGPRTCISEMYRCPLGCALEKQNLQSLYLEGMDACHIGSQYDTVCSRMETPRTDDRLGISIDLDNYGTVVGEAIQGLLNLSSSQESASSCLDSTFI